MKARASLIAAALAVPAVAGAKEQPHAVLKDQFGVAFADQCPIGGVPYGAESAALVAVFAPFIKTVLIDTVVDLAVAAVKAAGEEKHLQWKGSGSASLYSVTANGDLKFRQTCMIVSRGDVVSEKKAQGATAKRADKAPLRDKLAWQWKEQGIAGEPYFYFEAGLQPSEDGSAFRLVPRALFFRGGETNSWGGGDRRDLVLTFSVYRPGGQGGETPFGSVTLTLPRLAAGAAWARSGHCNEVTGKCSAWMPALPLDEEQKKTVAAIRTVASEYEALEAAKKEKPAPISYLADAAKAYCEAAQEAKQKDPQNCPDDLARKLQALRFNESRAAAEKSLKQRSAPKGMDQFGPYSVGVTLTETREANKFLQALAKSLEANAGDLKTGLGDALDPTKRRAAREAARASERSAEINLNLKRQAIVDAENLVLEVQAELAALKNPTETERAIAQNKLRKAKIAANSKYVEADLPPPYADTGF